MLHPGQSGGICGQVSGEDLKRVSDWYRQFAEHEAITKSPLYSALASSIADDDEVLALLAELPPIKRQPNLLFGVYRSLFGLASDWADFRQTLILNWPALAARMLERRTQTNEPQRCALLMPVLAQLPQPLSIIEVGASAGLCLYPDLYGYNWDGHALPSPLGDTAPQFPCSPSGDIPIPASHPEVIWRAGLDINPLDVNDTEAMKWLETLVWPEQEERATRLHQAIKLARRNPAKIVRGDVIDDLPALLEQAPAGSTTVVFHTAVLNYVEAERREHFAAMVMEHADYWIANEHPAIFPSHIPAAPAPRGGMFVMALNRKPVAWTDSHGASMHWVAE